MSRRGWLLFAAMGVIWGVPYLLIKVAVEHLDPWTLVLARTALGAALLLPLAAARRELRPVLVRWRPVLLFSAVEIMAPWLLLGYAEQELSSSLTGLLLAAIPIVGAVLAWAGPGHDRFQPRQLVGLLVGIVGVAALVGLDLGAIDLVSVLALAVVVVCYAVGPVILTRRLADLPGMGVIAVSLALAAVVYVPMGVRNAPGEAPPPEVLWAVAALAVVCTALAFVLFFKLVAEVGPVRSTIVTYVNPAVAVLLGVLVLDEPFTAAIAVGFALVLLGSVLSSRRGAEAGPPARRAADGPLAPVAEVTTP